TGHAILEDAPAAPSTRAPPVLARIVERCLRKDPAERFQSARELADALGAISARAPARHRRRIIAIAAAMLVSAIASMLLLRLMPHGGTAPRLTVAAADFVNDTGEPELDGLSGMLITALEQSRRFSVLTRSRMFDVLKQIGQGE